MTYIIDHTFYIVCIAIGVCTYLRGIVWLYDDYIDRRDAKRHQRELSASRDEENR